MTAGFDLPSAQLGTVPGVHSEEPDSEDVEPGSVHSATAAPEQAEEKEQAETAHAPVSFGEEQPARSEGGTLSAGEMTDALRPTVGPLQSAQFGAGGGLGGGASAHRETELPQDSQRAQELNSLSKASAAELAGRARSTVGTSQQHIARIWGNQPQQ